MKREVTIVTSPFRIVSLVPSQTELLVDLGLEEHIVGVTKFCIHPEGMKKRVQIIGGTKTLNLAKIKALKPDLIIGNKEENTQAEIDLLAKEFPVWMSDIFNLNDALEMIGQVGEITNSSEKAASLINEIRMGFDNLKFLADPKKRVAYFIWKDPWMCAGKETFIDDMLERLGFVNAVDKARYPECELKSLDADFVFLSSEPYPFSEKHVQEVQRCLPNAKVVIVDGEFFSWYGSRLLQAPAYFQQLIKNLDQS
jgi:ABC-type Fe3+-hydroxamate transport system substrate-binding protein